MLLAHAQAQLFSVPLAVRNCTQVQHNMARVRESLGLVSRTYGHGPAITLPGYVVQELRWLDVAVRERLARS